VATGPHGSAVPGSDIAERRFTALGECEVGAAASEDAKKPAGNN